MTGPAQFCTLFDRNYLVRGLALERSLRRHIPGATLWILALDDETLDALRRLGLRDVRALGLPELEERFPELREASRNRSRVEYYFTLKPFLMGHVLSETRSVVAYLDSDLYFFSDLRPLLHRLEERDTLLTPHRFSPGLEVLERYGRFNAGFIAFSSRPGGRRMLEWWRERCREWCHDRVEAERFGDQKYLNTMHERFPGAEALADRGTNLAPWNVSQYRVEFRGGRVLVSGDPLIFYHFHMFRRLAMGVYGSGLEPVGAVMTETLRRRVYEPYIADLRRVELRLRSLWGARRPVWGTIRHSKKRDTIRTTIAFILRGTLLLPGRPHRFWAGMVPRTVGLRRPTAPVAEGER